MRHQIGESGRISKPLPTLCCDCVIQPGTWVELCRRVSDQPGQPREVLIKCFKYMDEPEEGYLANMHKVRISKIWFEGEESHG